MSLRRRPALRWLLAALGLALVSRPAAAVTRDDVVVAARALGFVEHPLKGDISVGIVFNPSNASSSQDADTLQKLLSSGLRVGNLTLKPVPIKLENLELSNVQLIFLTDGMGADATRVSAAAQAKKIPCVTVDLDQIQSGRCTVGVRSQPKVEILVNRANAATTGVVFSPVFRMMITEF